MLTRKSAKEIEKTESPTTITPNPTGRVPTRSVLSAISVQTPKEVPSTPTVSAETRQKIREKIVNDALTGRAILQEQLNEAKREIEALKAENSVLKAQVEELKTKECAEIKPLTSEMGTQTASYANAAKKAKPPVPKKIELKTVRKNQAGTPNPSPIGTSPSSDPISDQRDECGVNATEAAEHANDQATIGTRTKITQNEWIEVNKKSTHTKNHIGESSYANLLRSPPKPDDFSIQKIYARVGMAPELRMAKKKTRINMIQKVFTAWGIKKKILDFSFIGKSVIELFAYKANAVAVKETLLSKGLELCSNFDVQENLYNKRAAPDCEDSIVNRIGFFIFRNENRLRLIDAMLNGHTERVQEKSKIKAKEITDANKAKGEDDGGCPLNV